MRGHQLLEPLLPAPLAEDEKQLLPRRWQILGDLVLVNIPAKIEHLKHDIGEALLDLYPRCKSALWDKGIRGSLRTPNIEVIAGSETAPSTRKTIANSHSTRAASCSVRATLRSELE